MRKQYYLICILSIVLFAMILVLKHQENDQLESTISASEGPYFYTTDTYYSSSITNNDHNLKGVNSTFLVIELRCSGSNEECVLEKEDITFFIAGEERMPQANTFILSREGNVHTFAVLISNDVDYDFLQIQIENSNTQQELKIIK